MPDPTVIGETLRLWRMAAGWSQQEAAIAAGLSHQTSWSKVESGTRTVSLSEAVTFANTLGVSVEALRYPPLTLLQALVAGPAERIAQGGQP